MTLIEKRWGNIKWLLKELIKVVSSEKSFFSQKRIQQMIAFTSGEVALLSFFFYNIAILTAWEAIGIASLFFTLAGYVLTKTEKAKESYESNKNNLEDLK